MFVELSVLLYVLLASFMASSFFIALFNLNSQILSSSSSLLTRFYLPAASSAAASASAAAYAIAAAAPSASTATSTATSASAVASLISLQSAPGVRFFP